MWSFTIEPVKCLRLMEYTSTDSTAGISAIVAWNAKRVFTFPWTADSTLSGTTERVTVTP